MKAYVDIKSIYIQNEQDKQKQKRNDRKELTMALSYEKLNELFTGVGLKLGEEETKKCYEALELYYKEIPCKKKVSGRGRVSGYMMWLNENRENIREVHLKGVELTGRSKVTEVAKKGGELWKALSEEEKTEWKNKACEKSLSMPKKGVKKKWSFDLSNDEGDTDVEGFSGPHVGNSLDGKTEYGFKRGEGSFSTLEEAISAAKLLGAKCGGVTKGKSGYTLRSGIEMKIVSDPLYKKFTKTWLRGDITEEKVEEIKSKKKVKKVLKKKVETKKEEEVETKKEEEVETKNEEEVETKKEEEVETKNEEEEEEVETKNEEEEEEEEDEVEEEEEESEDEADTEEWEYKGTKYLVDEETNMVYDYDTHDEIGIRKKGKLVLKKK